MFFARDNKYSFNDDDFGVSGCAYQLFKIFANEYDFSLKEKIRHECFNCNSVCFDAEKYRSVFISFSKNYFQLKDIPLIFNILCNLMKVMDIALNINVI